MSQIENMNIPSEAKRAAEAAYRETLTGLRLAEGGGFKVPSQVKRSISAALDAAAPRIREQGYEDGVQAVRDALLAFAEERDNALGAIRSHITTFELRKLLGVEE
ncbi:hypothetical protein ACFC25_04165 [Pseudarthrobacter sp. NPDC055928]|uniref:hypothetical protein n=1 Tax=Pseudarthrobacter sp. NPDC055928 TaxID=3345661 RepID=UPI0035DCCE06